MTRFRTNLMVETDSQFVQKVPCTKRLHFFIPGSKVNGFHVGTPRLLWIGTQDQSPVLEVELVY